MNTDFNSNVIWLQLEYKMTTLVGTFKYEFGFINYISILLFINTRVLYVQYLIFGLFLFTATATWPPYGAASLSACHVAHV